MLGKMLEKARIEKGFTKKDLAILIDIDTSYLSHIEKGDRIPSHKILKKICKALNIPFQPLMFTYDKELPKTKKNYNPVEHISYNKILAIEDISSFVDCPSNVPSSAVAIKMKDSNMLSTFDMNSYIYLELNSPLKPNDIGLFYYNSKILIRHFKIEYSTIILKSDTDEKIIINSNDIFYIIGKILR